jgi:hypothetical protein
MSAKLELTATEREKIGILINNVCVYAAQLVALGHTDFPPLALRNLAKLKREHGPFMKRLDEFCRARNEEIPLRVIEDLRQVPRDVTYMLKLVQRCLSLSAFLGHLLSQPGVPVGAAETVLAENWLH